MYGVLVDVSGSMESAYALDRSHRADVERIHAIITTLVNIVNKEVTHHERKESIFASAFGVKARSAVTCDLIALLDKIEETKDGYSIKGINNDKNPSRAYSTTYGYQELKRLACRENVAHIIPWISDYLTNDEAGYLYQAVSNDQELLKDLVKKIPSNASTKVYGAASEVGRFFSKTLGLQEKYDRHEDRKIRNSDAYKHAQGFIQREEREMKRKFEEEMKEMKRRMYEDFVINIIKDIQFPQPRPVQEVSEMLSGLLHQDSKAAPSGWQSQQDDHVHRKIQKMIEPIKPYIFGRTPMCRALTDAKAAFEKSTTTPKVLFLLSDGQSTDGDPRDIAKTLRENDVTIVTCYLTAGRIANSRCLLDPNTRVKDRGCQTLFEMSSIMKNIETPVSYLTDAGWELPDSGESRLFLQANSLDVVNEFCKVLVAQLTSPCDALVHLLEKVPLATYINQRNAEFKPKQQEEGTCYANAIAAVFHLAMHRIIGREGGIPDFYQIRDRLIKEYGVHGANTEKVLKKVCPEYRLQFREVDERGARQAINKRRPVVARFRLNDEQWTKFSNFFKNSPKEVLQKNDVTDTTHTDLSGHAVVLIRCDPNSLTFMNSWGTKFADGGFFRVKDKDVLNLMQFYDIYWTENDLLPSEKEAYRIKSTERAKQLADKFPSVQDLPHECPNCKRNSKVSEFLGHILEAECPCCHHKFTPMNEAILKSLYTRKFK